MLSPALLVLLTAMPPAPSVEGQPGRVSAAAPAPLPGPAELHEIEQQIRKTVATHFRAKPETERRAEGYRTLQNRTQPHELRILAEVLERQDAAAQAFLYEHLAEIGSPAARQILAHEAVFDDEPEDRAAALERLAATSVEEVPAELYAMIDAGLRSYRQSSASAAASLANRLNLIEAVPLMIAAQVAPSNASAQRSGPLGSIAFVTQQTYVQDLQPVVADGAVGFDPELGVVTEGVVLEVNEAIVKTYRTEVHHQLVDLTSRWSGSRTRGLGYDIPRWRDWYEKERERQNQPEPSAPEQDTP